MTVLNARTIRKLFEDLNAELQSMEIIGEVGICGGAVMCLVFNARESTKDVDGIFAPTREIREASLKVARRAGVPDDWLNDAAKSYFLADPPRVDVFELSNLRVWAPRADYMLAMKCNSARFDTHDADDVRFLIRHLGLDSPNAVFKIVEEFYPRRTVPPKTQFLVEEIFEGEQ